MTGYGIRSCCCGGCTGVCDDIPSLTFTADDTTDELTVTHNFNEDDQVLLYTSGTLPGGLSLNTTYYVIVVDPTTIQLALTAGGAAVGITDTGTGPHEITDTTYIERTWTDVGSWGVTVTDGSTPAGRTIENDAGMCVLKCQDPSDYPDSDEDDFQRYLTVAKPTGSGHQIVIGSRIWSLNRKGVDPPTLMTTSCGIGIERTITGHVGGISVVGRPQNVNEHRVSSAATGGTDIAVDFDDGEWLKITMTEDGAGAYDVDVVKTLSGSDTVLHTETSETYTMDTTLHMMLSLIDSGKAACWWYAVRQGT